VDNVIFLRMKKQGCKGKESPFVTRRVTAQRPREPWVPWESEQSEIFLLHEIYG